VDAKGDFGKKNHIYKKPLVREKQVVFDCKKFENQKQENYGPDFLDLRII
jgi:hypothetical protein